jgi:DNA-binding NarL/FixJ family response regulator
LIFRQSDDVASMRPLSGDGCCMPAKGVFVRILVCVGNQILSEGLKSLLAKVLPGGFLSDQFAGPAMADPELVLFDAHADINALKPRYPEAKFVCLDLGLSDCEIAYLLLCQGVNGIISPQLDVRMFIKALHVVRQGEMWVSGDYLKKALQQKPAASECRSYKTLSAQDKKIIALIVLGRKNREIADDLCLSEATVKAHVSRIYKALQVKNRAQLTSLASTNHWAPDPARFSLL